MLRYLRRWMPSKTAWFEPFKPFEPSEAGTPKSLIDKAGEGVRREVALGPPLLRQEAVAAANNVGYGRPIATVPLSWSILTIAMVLMAGSGACFLAFGTYTRKETAAGVVRSVAGDVRVIVPVPGIVRSVHVAEGQAVSVGDRLLVISTAQQDVNGTSSDQVFIEGLDREISDLLKRRRALIASASVDKVGLSLREVALEREINAAVAQRKATGERLALAKRALQRLRPAAEKGFISGETMRRREEEVIILVQALAEAEGARARLEGQKSQLATMRQQRPFESIKELGQLNDLIARAQREKADIKRQRGYSIVANSSGVITALQTGVGKSVDPQHTPMSIVSKKPKVVAEIFVPSRAIGFLNPGQEVRIRYDAFPYQRFGVANATIISISASILKPSEVDAAIKVDEPVYRVMVNLQKPYVLAYGKKYNIRTGILLSADVLLEKRSFAEWLLDPVLALRGRL